MKIYRAGHPLRYETVQLPDEEALAFYEVLQGERDPVDVPPVRVLRRYRRQLKPCEVFLTDPIVVMRAQVWRASAGVLAPFGRHFPVTCEEVELVAFDVVQVIDALDQEASQIFRYSFGDVIRVDSWAFREDRLPERAVFRIPQPGQNASILATEAVVRELAALPMTGLEWTAIWDSQTGPLTSSWPADRVATTDQ